MKKHIVWIIMIALGLSLCACRPTVQEDDGAGTSGVLIEAAEDEGASEPAIESPSQAPQQVEQSDTSTEDEASKPALPAVRPDDFAIYFKWGVKEGNYLDTYNGKVGKDMVAEEDVSAEYVVSRQLLDEIYGALLQHGIADIRTEMTSESLSKDGFGVGVTPNTTYLIRFKANGEEYSVRGDATSHSYAEAKGFHEFNGFMAEKIRTIWQELNFPEANSAYC